MQIIPAGTPQALALAIRALSRGQLVIYPTETCYGLAADATNPLAIDQLLSYKGDRHRQVAIAVSSRAMAEKYVTLNTLADNLYTHFLPGPLTVISTSLHVLDSRLESASGSLGVRLPNHPFALQLIRDFGRPVTATSANTSGKKEPYSPLDWQNYTTPQKQAMVELFLDAGHLKNRPTSTVVDTTLNAPEVLRQGELFLPHLPQSHYSSSSVEETIQLGKLLTSKFLNLTRQFPLIFALQGDLGTGKTQLSKGIAQALGITTTINSPTYTLLHEYPYRLPTRSHLEGSVKYSGMFYHLDAWRLPDTSEIETTLHLSQLLKPGNIISMEWAAKAKNLLEQYNHNCLIIYIEIKEKDTFTRTITYSVSTPEWT